MDSLPPDLLEEIIKNRPIYIGIKHIPEFDYSTTQIIGVYINEDNCKKKIIETAFSEIDGKFYDPAMRFFQEKTLTRDLNLYWVDNWENRIGISEYRIEEWKPEIGIVNTTFFNFDRWIKTKVSRECILSKDLQQMIIDWKEQLPKVPEEFMNLFVSKADGDEYLKDNFQDWIKIHGSKAKSVWA